MCHQAGHTAGRLLGRAVLGLGVAGVGCAWVRGRVQNGFRFGRIGFGLATGHQPLFGGHRGPTSPQPPSPPAPPTRRGGAHHPQPRVGVALQQAADQVPRLGGQQGREGGRGARDALVHAQLVVAWAVGRADRGAVFVVVCAVCAVWGDWCFQAACASERGRPVGARRRAGVRMARGVPFCGARVGAGPQTAAAAHHISTL
jgi:hypothetical protein